MGANDDLRACLKAFDRATETMRLMGLMKA
jgi:hypothetical protein